MEFSGDTLPIKGRVGRCQRKGSYFKSLSGTGGVSLLNLGKD